MNNPIISTPDCITITDGGFTVNTNKMITNVEYHFKCDDSYYTVRKNNDGSIRIGDT